MIARPPRTGVANAVMRLQMRTVLIHTRIHGRRRHPRRPCARPGLRQPRGPVAGHEGSRGRRGHRERCTLGARAPAARVRLRAAARTSRSSPRRAPGATRSWCASVIRRSRCGVARRRASGCRSPAPATAMNASAAAALAAPQLSLSLIGVPNCGKTALFNRLTGSRQKVANYPGVTVERKEGRLVGPRAGRIYRVVDLPGAYSLEPATLDEAIARDVVLGRHASEPAPDLLVCVVDATNLRLNLRLVLELKRLGRPMLVALNMSDVAEQRGYQLDRAALEQALGIPVIRTVAVRSGGERELVEAIDAYHFDADLRQRAHARLEAPATATAADIEATQREVRRVLDAAGYRVPARVAALARLDQVVLHPIAGPLLLGVVLFLMFQAVFSWAKAPQAWINAGVATLSAWLAGVLPAGPAARPDPGWRARRHRQRAGVPAADPAAVRLHPGAGGLRLPAARGLHARPADGARRDCRAARSSRCLSSFACAIPGVMAARTIPSNRDRLATIMIAPLMTCSARLPVYALLIGAFIPQRTIGFMNLRGPGAVRALPRRRGRAPSASPSSSRAGAATTSRARCCSSCPSTACRSCRTCCWACGSAPRSSSRASAPSSSPSWCCCGSWRASRPRPPVPPGLRSSTASPATSAAVWSTCSRRSASTGRSPLRWCRDWPHARWR